MIFPCTRLIYWMVMIVVILWLTAIIQTHRILLSSSTSTTTTIVGVGAFIVLPHPNNNGRLGVLSFAVSKKSLMMLPQSSQQKRRNVANTNFHVDSTNIRTIVQSSYQSNDEALFGTTCSTTSSVANSTGKQQNRRKSRFSLSTALLVSGLAFDAYVEPPLNSSRWEKGSQGLNVAFVSSAFTRQLYKGLIRVRVQRIYDLPSKPDGDNLAEQVMTGSGVDACLLVAVLEGSWKSDLDLLKKQQYHNGVLDLSGAAHVGRSSTAWSNVQINKSGSKKKEQRPYHISAGWGRGGQAIWPEPSIGINTDVGSEVDEEGFFLYIQDPAEAYLVFTVMDDNRLGAGTPIGSTYKRLSDLIPSAKLSHQVLVDEVKRRVVDQIKKSQSNALGDFDLSKVDEITRTQLGATTWQGELPLTSKPHKKDKNGQIMMGVAAGALLAGPVGSAAGAAIGAFYEGRVEGRIQLKLSYLPIPQVPFPRNTYTVHGGMAGIEWGKLFELYRQRLAQTSNMESLLQVTDLEHCFSINHDVTGATCAVYRSLERKLIVVSFRGTCAPIDLLTDVSLVQDAWIEGEDINEQLIAKVHSGFRSSLNSIARRLKELILATPAPGESISDYDMLVTGHSLGGALSTLFVADLGEHGIDAGRGLPQLVDSEPWWTSIINTVMGKQAMDDPAQMGPPRPKSLRLYNLGSPRVGNAAFAELFDALGAEGFITEAYRIVNGDDVVARLPRTMNALVLGQVGYEHVGTTVLVSQPDDRPTGTPLIWVEGESDNNACPVRDGIALTNPLSEGNLLADLVNTTREAFMDSVPDSNNILGNVPSYLSQLTAAVGKVSERFKTITTSDVVSVLGIQRAFTERELRLIQSLLQGKALAHHMEDQYYASLGRACGFSAIVNQELAPLPEE